MDIKVLIVDDEKGMRTIIEKILDKSGGFEVVGDTDNGDEAIGIFKEQRPEVVFLDVQMPGCSGIDCAKRLTDIDPKTIIIFATATTILANMIIHSTFFIFLKLSIIKISPTFN